MNNNQFSLVGKIALVTGASSGIGRQYLQIDGCTADEKNNQINRLYFYLTRYKG